MEIINFLMIFLFVLCFDSAFGQAELDTISRVVPINYELTVVNEINNCPSPSNNNFYQIISRLNKIGFVFNLETDDWYLDDILLVNEFNRAYKTQIFNEILCARKVYYSDSITTRLYTQDWIQIKEWYFTDSLAAKKAFNFIEIAPFSSDYFGPRLWRVIRDGNIIYLLCGASYDFWTIKAEYIEEQIKTVINHK